MIFPPTGVFAALRSIREQSNDPKTKTAAVFTTANGAILSLGANYIAHPEPDKLSRAERLALSSHAEASAARLLVNMPVPYRAVLTGTPCRDCARILVESGVVEVWIDDDEDPFKTRLQDPEYDFDESFHILSAAGIRLYRVSVCTEGF